MAKEPTTAAYNSALSRYRRKQVEAGELGKNKTDKAIGLARAVYVSALIWKLGTAAQVGAILLFRKYQHPQNYQWNRILFWSS